jgi:hypothetical protein
MLITFNSNTSNYASISMQAPSASNLVSSGSSTNFDQMPGTLVESNTFGSAEFYIASYSSSQNKPIQSFSTIEINSGTGYQIRSVGHVWSNSTAISSITIETSLGTMLSGSSFYLYGISNA